MIGPEDIIAYRLKDAERVSGIGKTKLWDLIATGELPVVRVGRRVLILRADLEAMLQRHRREGQ